jgi:hypothetical protein
LKGEENIENQIEEIGEEEEIEQGVFSVFLNNRLHRRLSSALG